MMCTGVSNRIRMEFATIVSVDEEGSFVDRSAPDSALRSPSCGCFGAFSFDAETLNIATIRCYGYRMMVIPTRSTGASRSANMQTSTLTEG